MKRILAIIVLLGCIFLIHIGAQANDHNRSYPQEAYDQALSDAGREGKLILLDFTAKWCTPCRWMKQTTFKDPVLSKYLTERYIVVNIDIDDFEGYTLKEKYDIKLLPTFIILNSQGGLLTRIEESMGATKMYALCKSYDTELNTIAHPQGRPKNIPETANRPFIEQPSKTNTPPTTQEASNTEPSTSMPATSGHYQLQLGVFNDFKNARKLADKVFNLFTENIEIKRLEGKYKVLLGYFETREEAEIRKASLEKQHFESIIIRI